MPRISKRLTYIKKWDDRVAKLKKIFIASLSSDDEVLDPDNYLYILYMIQYRKLQILTNKRYLFRSKKYRKHKGECPYDKHFYDDDDLPWLNEAEFLATYRMSRKSMKKFIETCKHHPLFEVLNKDKTINWEKTEKRTRKHLMHFMYFLGTCGEGGNNTNSRKQYVQGYGTYENMRETCRTVILDCMKDKYFYWLDEADRIKMSQLIWEKYGWPNRDGVAMAIAG